MFDRILIANRGEIAVRIIRACRDLGVSPVAVYSEADAEALHVRLADEAVCVGPPPSTESYLDQDAILAAAAQTGAQAIHPGYGFLSENAGFARRVEEAGLVWIGPSPAAMDAMGDKVSARANAEAAGVPVAPGTEALKDGDDAAQQAETIGYPVMLKASAGGGGIGMRIVRDASDIREQFDSATAQAASAFGVPDVFMEKFIERPRHIEVQIIGDSHGNVVHLYERECSIQRRHQKLIEEAPSPALSDAEREDIGRRAVALAKHVDYVNAGTLEFLFERGDDGAPNWYFNEMNTRLQVEHPVTEQITGIDLVKTQLRVAAGEELGFEQADITINGHAIEARINAEDPRNDFTPSPGPVTDFEAWADEGVRIDTCLYAGWTVPAVYDSMVAKLIVHADDRGAAIDRLRSAADDLVIEGFTTNLEFHRRLMDNATFQRGDLSTRFLEEQDVMGSTATRAHRLRAAAIVAALAGRPGGGLAAFHFEQRLPAKTGHRHAPGRDWSAA